MSKVKTTIAIVFVYIAIFTSLALITAYSSWQVALGVALFGWALIIDSKLNGVTNERAK